MTDDGSRSSPPQPWGDEAQGALNENPDVLPSHPGDEAPRTNGRWRWLMVGGAGVATLVLVAGVAFAVRGLWGGGAQPESALPGGAVAFAKVDLDPSAGQKIDGVRFARKFPAVRDKISGGDADLRKDLYAALAEQAGWSDIDYATQVEPWLGQRVGIAAYPQVSGADEDHVTDVIVALQITDEGAARKGLDRLKRSASDTDQQMSYVIVGDYALLTGTASATRRAASAGTPLEDDAHFKSDMSALGDGVAAAWVDLHGMAKLTRESLGSMFGLAGMSGMTGGASGRATYLVHFDGPNVLEVKGALVGSDVRLEDPRALTRFTELPEGSLFALGLADGNRLVPQTFESIRKAADASGDGEDFDDGVRMAEQELDLQLAEDLAVLAGTNFVAAVTSVPSSDASLDVGARVTTDPKRAMTVISKITDALLATEDVADFPIVSREVEDGIIVATNDAQADRLARKGKLGDNVAFRAVLPDLERAGAAFWVDLGGVVAASADESGKPIEENLKPLRAVGASGVWEDDASARYTLRLLVR